jgi:hypothetical protein
MGSMKRIRTKTSFSGTYVYTQDASPFEVFLAEAQEYMIDYEAANYNVQRPIAITNWVTTDPLSHPGEPYPETEDVVSVDVEHIKATSAYTAGFFASYHVYPYYPDLIAMRKSTSTRSIRTLTRLSDRAQRVSHHAGARRGVRHPTSRGKDT